MTDVDMSGNCNLNKMTDPSPDGVTCTALLRCGLPCRYPAKREHLCGIHFRSSRTTAECSICMCGVSRRKCRMLGCKHMFHKRCIRKWFGKGSLTCPMCRTICLDHLSINGTSIGAQVRALFRTVPPPANVYFPTYMIALLNTPEVARALHLTEDLRQLLIEITLLSFTQTQYLKFLDQLRL